MIDQFLQFFKRPQFPGTNGRFAVAASGGIDSMVLCHLCQEAGLRFFVVHCNFQLRGAESERDETFIRTWCYAHGIEALVKKFDTESYAEMHGVSIQEAARELRYAWFRQLCKEKACDYTLLAHHANDSIETALMNYFRGTGLQGLTGIPESGPFFLRPLLGFSRARIREYAVAHGLQWVEDSSNLSLKYTRNYFRNQLIPAVKTVFPAVEENLFHNIERFKSTAALYMALVNELKKKIARPIEGGIKVPVLQLAKWSHTALLFELIREYGFTEKQLPDVERLLRAPSGKFVSSATHRIIRHRNHLIFTTLATASASFITVEDTDRRLAVGHDFILTVEHQKLRKKPFHPDHDAHKAQLDASKLAFPLVLRKWRQGDYFYPLGMSKKKKLARFLIDQKLSLAQKEHIWVLESAQRIVWVVGMRIDDRFKVNPATTDLVSFSVASP